MTYEVTQILHYFVLLHQWYQYSMSSAQCHLQVTGQIYAVITLRPVIILLYRRFAFKEHLLRMFYKDTEVSHSHPYSFGSHYAEGT